MLHALFNNPPSATWLGFPFAFVLLFLGMTRFRRTHFQNHHGWYALAFLILALAVIGLSVAEAVAEASWDGPNNSYLNSGQHMPFGVIVFAAGIMLTFVIGLYETWRRRQGLRFAACTVAVAASWTLYAEALELHFFQEGFVNLVGIGWLVMGVALLWLCVTGTIRVIRWRRTKMRFTPAPPTDDC